MEGFKKNEKNFWKGKTLLARRSSKDSLVSKGDRLRRGSKLNKKGRAVSQQEEMRDTEEKRG